jgi:hypothetical protein
MEYCVAKREDVINIIELYKQLNPTNNDFPFNGEAKKAFELRF